MDTLAEKGGGSFGPGFMRITTALPDDNARFLAALQEAMAHA